MYCHLDLSFAALFNVQHYGVNQLSPQAHQCHHTQSGVSGGSLSCDLNPKSYFFQPALGTAGGPGSSMAPRGGDSPYGGVVVLPGLKPEPDEMGPGGGTMTGKVGGGVKISVDGDGPGGPGAPALGELDLASDSLVGLTGGAGGPGGPAVIKRFRAQY